MSASRPLDSAHGKALENVLTKRPPWLRAGLVLYAGAVLIAGWLYGWWQIQRDRAVTMESSSNNLTLSAVGFANHVEAMINDGVGAAVAAANEIRANDAGKPVQVDATLRNMLTGGDYVRTLFVITPTRYYAAHRDATGGERPPYAAELLTSVNATWVGHPLNAEQGDANVLIPIAKRIDDLGGEAAWAGTVLSFAALDALYRTLPVEQSGLALTHVAGTVLARVPSLPGYRFAGVDVSAYPSIREYTRQTSDPYAVTAYESDDPFSGNRRQFAVQPLRDYPIRAIASRDIDNSLIGWKERTRGTMTAIAGGSALLLAMTVALYLLLNRRYEALRRSEERFQLAVNASNDGIWDWDLRTGYVYYSPRFKQCLEFTADDEFPPEEHTFWKLTHPDDAQRIRIAIRRHLEDREPYELEFRIRTRSGGYRWFLARGLAVWDESGAAVRMAGSITDIDDKRRAEDSLRASQQRELHAREEFAQHLISAQEQERQRLANELHDSVGQNLSLIKNRALLVLKKQELPEDVAHHVSALSELATDVIAEVRTVAQNLRPLHIEQLGLTDALQTLLDKAGESSSLLIERRLENVDDVLTGSAATHLYRIVQEALNNVFKHARAQRCRIRLERDVSCVRLTIADNGVGFDARAETKRHGLGLASIAERARMLSASLAVESQPLGATAGNSGTVIRIEIPIIESPTASGAFAATIPGEQAQPS